mmetsp:Transcript_22321/g.50468  ORF Transcript_22321/g.50468 Transcript_22321/m.50468 type:complete len:127 (-) Transcript_22321:428-808(-)|eukprot:CAMPEP_0172591296 /NCGR_PEP_ID=MMETSP1068-20121228/10008_1 /TAXON_ID=35684 /ORGANISM="Pseudopedinella elastica, Strain CCMP716" /LENGTH=126 /DNA_ID=CAMNT_0013387631 /DNA_START=19 /DNA_END=399 /DNA_ORIENTATION=+
MVRGHAKAEAQKKNAASQAAKVTKGSQLGKADAALTYKCSLCMQVMPNPKLFQQHYESKHPGTPLPPDIQAELDALSAKKAAGAAAKSGGAAEQASAKKPAKKKKDDSSALLLEGLNGKPSSGKKK